MKIPLFVRWIFEIKKKLFIYIWSKLVFESLEHKIDTHLHLLYSLTTYLIFVSVS